MQNKQVRTKFRQYYYTTLSIVLQVPQINTVKIFFILDFQNELIISRTNRKAAYLLPYYAKSGAFRV